MEVERMNETDACRFAAVHFAPAAGCQSGEAEGKVRTNTKAKTKNGGSKAAVHVLY
jgi:hypothetical protein